MDLIHNLNFQNDRIPNRIALRWYLQLFDEALRNGGKAGIQRCIENEFYIIGSIHLETMMDRPIRSCQLTLYPT